MKAQKPNPNKIYYIHDIPNDDNDCNRIDADKDNEDWRNDTTKEVKRIYPKEWGPLGSKDVNSTYYACTIN